MNISIHNLHLGPINTLGIHKHILNLIRGGRMPFMFFDQVYEVNTKEMIKKFQHFLRLELFFFICSFILRRNAMGFIKCYILTKKN